MTKQKIKTIAQSGVNKWTNKQGEVKDLVKWFVQFEDNTNGTLTTGFDPTPPPVVGDEIEYTIEDKGFGIEIKLARAGGGGGFGGGGKKWTPEQVAQQDAVKIVCAALHAGLPIGEYKSFFVECKAFMVEMDKPKAAGSITEAQRGMPATEVVNAQNEQANPAINPSTGLPF